VPATDIAEPASGCHNTDNRRAAKPAAARRPGRQRTSRRPRRWGLGRARRRATAVPTRGSHRLRRRRSGSSSNCRSDTFSLALLPVHQGYYQRGVTIQRRPSILSLTSILGGARARAILARDAALLHRELCIQGNVHFEGHSRHSQLLRSSS